MRNYLPDQLDAIRRARSQGSGTGIRGLTTDVQSAITANAVLSPQQLATLSPADQQHIQAARQWSAVQQALAQEALATRAAASPRFKALIAAISTASGSEGNPRSAGADQRRARHAAKRADQVSGSLSGDPGAGIGRCGSRQREQVDRRTGTASTPAFSRLPETLGPHGILRHILGWLNGQLATYIGDNTARLASRARARGRYAGDAST